MGSGQHGPGNDGKDASAAALREPQWYSFRGQRMLEVFSGCGRLSKACQHLGLPMFPIDIIHGDGDDVLKPNVRNHIFSLVRQKRVTFVWIGMPCTTFSIARRHDGLGPGPLRSDSYPMGLPGLSEKDNRKLRQGNALLYFTFELIQLCQRVGVPWALENPDSSRCWITPKLLQLASVSHKVTLDFCQYNEPWRKRTTIMYSGWDASSLRKLCKGHGNFCSRTGKAHLSLKGVSPSGQFWTLVAQPYPLALVADIAQLLYQQVTNQIA